MLKSKIGFFVLAISVSCSLFANQSSQEPLCRRFSSWRNFCFEHLAQDPKAASSWNWGYRVTNEEHAQCRADDERKRLCTDTKDHEQLFTAINCCIDPSLIDKIGSLQHHIPRLSGQTCDYIYCKKCQSPVVCDYRRVSGWFPNGQKYGWSKVYFCPSHTHHMCWSGDYLQRGDHPRDLLLKGKEDSCSPIWHGYFQKYRSPFFDHFVTHLEYCEQNPACRCHWPEESVKMHAILDEIMVNIVGIDPNISEAELENFIKFDNDFYLPQGFKRLSGQFAHSVFYSQVKEALLSMDPLIAYCFLDSDKRPFGDSFFHIRVSDEIEDEEDLGYTRAIKEWYSEFCNGLLEKIRPAYIELYQECYAKHPHPRIQEELDLLLADCEGK